LLGSSGCDAGDLDTGKRVLGISRPDYLQDQRGSGETQDTPGRFFHADDGGHRFQYLLEIDRSTEDNQRFLREKILPGLAYLKSEAYAERFGHRSGRWLHTCCDLQTERARCIADGEMGEGFHKKISEFFENSEIWLFRPTFVCTQPFQATLIALLTPLADQ